MMQETKKKKKKTLNYELDGFNRMAEMRHQAKCWRAYIHGLYNATITD